jgi:N-methylhydantoinase A
MLRVGPESAGAAPGPACYGRGGTLPTVTDANAVLGRLPAALRLGGHLELQASAAVSAFQPLARAMGLGVEQAAAGVIRLVNEHMVQALRLISVRRGLAIDDFTLVSFGGAGGLHVCALADLLGLRRALVPLHAGVLSALGMLLAPRQRLLSHSLQALLAEVPERQIADLMEQLRATALRELLAEGVLAAVTATQYSVDLRYRGQSYTLELPWQSAAAAGRAFHERHEREYGHRMAVPIELVNVRVLVRAAPPAIELPPWQAQASAPRDYVAVHGHSRPVLRCFRDSLRIGERLQGPAIICETAATTFIGIDWTGEMDSYGNLLLKKQ